MIEQHRRWLQYERDIFMKTVGSLESVPTERQCEPDYKRAVSILAHIVAARRIWLERFGELSASDVAMFPEDANLQSVTESWHEVAGRWTELLKRRDDAWLTETFEYRSMDAGKFRNSIEEVLTQMFGHGFYHRGQIAMLVKNVGGVPAITDYIYWCRQPLS